MIIVWKTYSGIVPAEQGYVVAICINLALALIELQFHSIRNLSLTIFMRVFSISYSAL